MSNNFHNTPLEISNQLVGRDTEIALLQDLYRRTEGYSAIATPSSVSNKKKILRHSHSSGLRSTLTSSTASAAKSVMTAVAHTSIPHFATLKKKQKDFVNNPSSASSVGSSITTTASAASALITSRSVFVRGLSGTGKSALVQHTFQGLVEQQQEEAKQHRAMRHKLKQYKSKRTNRILQRRSIHTEQQQQQQQQQRDASKVSEQPMRDKSGEGTGSAGVETKPKEKDSKSSAAPAPAAAPTSTNYFVRGKFDLMSCHRPFSALVDALNDLCRQIIVRKQLRETPEKQNNNNNKKDDETVQNDNNNTNKNTPSDGTTKTLADLKESILEAIPQPDELQQIINLLPSLAQLLGLTRSPSLQLRSSLMLGADDDDETADQQQDDPTGMADATSVTTTPHGRTQEAMKQSFLQFKSTVRKLIQILVEDNVLVLFIDDLQWASIESLDLIEHLMKCMEKTRLLFIGGFRSDEVDADHYLTTLMKGNSSISSNSNNNSGPTGGVNVSSNVSNYTAKPVVITIEPLQVEDVTLFLANTLRLEDESQAFPLAELIYDKTQGNIFFVRQFIDFLHTAGHLYFNLKTYHWEWEDLATIQDVISASNDGKSNAQNQLENVVTQKILRMPPDTLEALKLGSCLGSRFDMEVIDSLLDKWRQQKNLGPAAPIEEILWKAVEEELLEELQLNDPFSASESIQYKFTHDKVQSSAYSLLGEEEKEYCLVVGDHLRELYENLEHGEGWMLILSAGHLYKSKSLMNHQIQRDTAAEVNFVAAQELLSHSAFRSAAIYLRNAIELIGEQGWERCYEITLSVHNLSVQMEYNSGNPKECDERTEQIMKKARSLIDQQTAYHIKMIKLSSLRQHDAALNTGLLYLRKMKLSRIPKRITWVELYVEFPLVLSRVRRESEDDLLNRKITSDPKVTTFIQVLMSSAVFAWFANKTPEFMYLATRALKISLLHGYAPYSPTSFAVCGMICGRLGWYQRADKLGRIALKLATRFEAANVDCFTQYFYYTCIYHLFTKANDMNQRFAQLYTMGIQTADVPWAFTAAGARILCAWLEGTMQLDKFIALAARHRDEMVSYNKRRLLPTIQIYRQLALNLARRSQEQSKLQGDEIKNLEDFTNQAQNDPVSLRRIVMASLELAYYYDDLDEAEKYARLSSKNWKEDQPLYASFFVPFHRGLVWCKLFHRSPSSVYRRKAMQELKILRNWERAGLVNPGVLLKLLQAEIKGFIERRAAGEVKEAYDEAIRGLTDHGFQHLASLGAERAAVFFMDQKGQSFAHVHAYLLEAFEGYQTWKALGKAEDILDHHAVYLPQSALEQFKEVSFSSFRGFVDSNRGVKV